MSEENGAQNGGEKRKVEDEGENLRFNSVNILHIIKDWNVISHYSLFIVHNSMSMDI